MVSSPSTQDGAAPKGGEAASSATKPVSTAATTTDPKDSKGDGKKKPQEPMVPYGMLLQFRDGWDKFLWVIGFICALGNGATMPAFSLVFGHLLDSFHPGSPNDEFFDNVKLFSWIIALVGLASWVLSYLEIAPFTISGERQMRKLREAYVHAILQQDIKWFDERNIDELVTKVTDDTATMSQGIGDKVGMGLRFLSMFLFGFGMGFYYSWQMTLIMLAMAPLMAFCGALMMKVLSEFESQGQAAYAKAGGVAEERLGGIRTVQAFAGQDAALESYSTHLQEAMRAGMKKGVTQGGSMGFTMLIMFFTYALAFWVGSVLIAHDREGAMGPLVAAGCKGGSDFRSICMDPATWEPLTNTACWSLCPKLYECLSGTGCHSGGVVVEVFFAVIMGSMAIGQATPSATAMTSARVAGKRIFDVINSSNKDTSGGGTRDAPKAVTQGISFKNVAFSYPTRPDQKVLRDFSLDIKPGATVALVGRSGCGKSTVVGLLEKFYRADAGSILIDGVEISEYHTEKLRAVIGLVGQEPVLFSGTIADNIAFGSPSPVTDADIREAAAAANAASFIDSFPDGYQTLVGQGGKALSGGQKQRIAIARALIRKPALMLLDEATSALDSTSEAVVQAALDQIMRTQSCIKIVIAHRLSTIKNADMIVVVNEGQVAELGTHDELMKMQGGIYRDLVEAQASGRDGQLADEVKADEAEADEAAVAATTEIIDVEAGDRDRTESRARTRTRAASMQASKEAKEEVQDVPLGRLMRLSSDSLLPISTAFISSILQGVVMPIFALVFAEIITLFFEPTTEKMRSDASFWALMFVAIGVACGIAGLGQFGSFAVVGERVTRKLRYASLKAMLHQDMAFHDQEKNNTGALTTRLATDATLRMTTERFAVTTQNLVTAITGLIISFTADWRLTLVVLSVGPLIVAAGVIQMKAFAGATTAAAASLARAGHVVSESIHGIRTVHAFNLQSQIMKTYGERLTTPMKAGMKGGHTTGIGFGFSQFVMIAAYGLAFYVGGIWVKDGSLTFNLMLRVLMTVMMTAMSLGQASSMSADMTKAKTAAAAIFKLLDSTPGVDSSSAAGLRPPSVAGTIEFRDVSFTYPTRQGRVLKHFSLTIPAGNTVALVGSSGSGKSTIVSLLQRFYLPDSGTILVDSRDVTELNVQWLRKQIGIVSQEPILFKGTVAENIAYGKHPEDGPASQQEIEAAARSANAHDFIMADLPNGYDTDISSTTLSGGQKQRIAIARAIIRDPHVLLLDEATSALDNRSEEIVQRALDELMQAKRRTTIVIAHRLSTIKNSDLIVVMDKGEIIQQGTHDQLKSTPGKYKEMWDQQLLVAQGERIA